MSHRHRDRKAKTGNMGKSQCSPQRHEQITPKCGNCSRMHSSQPETCPARTSVCNGCGKVGHCKRSCRSSGVRQKTSQQNAKVYSVHAEEDGERWPASIYTSTLSLSLSLSLSINSILSGHDPSHTEALVQPPICSSSHCAMITCKLDTGAEGNVMPIETYRKLVSNKSILSPSSTSITAYGGHEIKQLACVISQWITTVTRKAVRSMWQTHRVQSS